MVQRLPKKAQEAKQTEKAFVDAHVAEWQEFTSFSISAIIFLPAQQTKGTKTERQ